MHIAVTFTLGAHPKVTFGVHKDMETAKKLSKEKRHQTPGLAVTVSNAK